MEEPRSFRLAVLAQNMEVPWSKHAESSIQSSFTDPSLTSSFRAHHRHHPLAIEMEGLGKKILPPISHKTRASAPWPASSSPSIGRMSFSQRREGTLRRAAGRRSRVAGHHSPVVDPGQTLALLVYERRRRRRRRLSSRCGRQGTAPPIARFGGGEPFCARDGIKRPQPSSQLRLLGQAGVRSVAR